MTRLNVLARIPRPTQKAYRAAVAKIIRDVQAEYGLNDPDLADRLGCSAPTIANARNERTDLNGVTLANIEREFGPSALDPFLALGGSRAVPLMAEDAITNATLEISKALHLLIRTQCPDSPGGVATMACELHPIVGELRDARTKLDAMIAVAEGRAVRAVA